MGDILDVTRLSVFPALGRTPTDRDWHRFVRESFDVIQGHFHRKLQELEQRGDSVETELDAVDSRHFLCRVYVGGKLEAECKIWLGSTLGPGDQIYYSTQDVGRGSDNSWNECIHPADDRSQLALSTLGMPMGRASEGVNLARMSPQDAASYLWRVFTEHLR